ncbi:MAG: hypothetical protein EKK40_06980 [Bradyrhizobiaceae bacterium]|nr:MAG: hypothetical protein EKK40_06980 [Bradyrhizobiaceae bacterium]
MTRLIYVELLLIGLLLILLLFIPAPHPTPIIVPHCLVKTQTFPPSSWFLPCSMNDVYYEA